MRDRKNFVTVSKNSIKFTQSRAHKNNDWGEGCSLTVMAWYQPKLHELVLLNDDTEELVALIKAGHDVNQQDSSCRTPLDYCVSLGECYDDFVEESK